MNVKIIRWFCLFAGAVSCSTFAEDQSLPYVLMNEDLSQLKSDFNEAVDQVRLVFIVGPT